MKRPNQAPRLLLDLGSRSAKSYLHDQVVIESGQVTWELIEGAPDESKIRQLLKSLIAPHQLLVNYRIFAIGTEAMRRNGVLEAIVVKTCNELGIRYKTLTQHEEATLILKALPDQGRHMIVNTGGGSIQLVCPFTRTLTLLGFGITDLNKAFSLLEPPAIRRVDACIRYIRDQLPVIPHAFIYTGGEKRYLKHFGVPLADDVCKHSDFAMFADHLSTMPLEKLERDSPYDSKWMRGAVASNCIVLALLSKANADYFFASDLNIAHGLVNGAAQWLDS